MKAGHSFSGVYKTIAAILIPTIILAWFFIFYIRDLMSERVISVFDARITNTFQEEGRRINALNSLMQHLVMNDEDVALLKEDGNSAAAMTGINNHFTRLHSVFSDRYHFFLYFPEKQIFTAPTMGEAESGSRDLW